MLLILEFYYMAIVWNDKDDTLSNKKKFKIIFLDYDLNLLRVTRI